MKKKLLSTLLVLALVLALLPTGAAAYGGIINDQPKPWEIYEYDETYFNSWNDYWQYMYQNGYIYYNGEWIYVGSDYDTGYYDITYSYDYTEGYVSGPSSSDGGGGAALASWPGTATRWTPFPSGATAAMRP